MTETLDDLPKELACGLDVEDAIAMVAALTVLPALFGVLGHRVDALSLRRSRRVPRPAVPTADGADHGFWCRLAHSIMRRPVI